jgi:hypothetical protein
MNKVRVRHEESLTFHHQDTKTQSFQWNRFSVRPGGEKSLVTK